MSIFISPNIKGGKPPCPQRRKVKYVWNTHTWRKNRYTQYCSSSGLQSLFVFYVRSVQSSSKLNKTKLIWRRVGCDSMSRVQNLNISQTISIVSFGIRVTFSKDDVIILHINNHTQLLHWFRAHPPRSASPFEWCVINSWNFTKFHNI